MSQVEELGLHKSYDVQEKESNKKKAYLKRFDTTDAWELEAAKPNEIEDILDRAIRTFINVTACNHEIELQNNDHEGIHDLQVKVKPVLRDLLLGSDDEGD